ncbi:hypothetical protein FRB95_014793 [Tulasnella sp. JGI-2019a]|nr:hypothetical protein FRB95_014793 [Tulasnella sp. JGI-2019a]
MSPSITSGAIRTNAGSVKEKHRLQELPQPRGLACKACRKKKHLCDRQRPSCRACSVTKIDCVYVDRKPHITVAELEDVLRNLERKYESRLKAAKKHAKRRMGSLKPNTRVSTTTEDEKSTPADRPSAGASDSDGFLQSWTLSLSAVQTELPYGGYHFDETFLTNSYPNNKTPSQPPNSYPSSCTLKKGTIPCPTRIFSCVPRYPPIPSPELAPIPLKTDMFEAHATTSASCSRNYPTSLSPDISHQFQVGMHDQWPSLPLVCCTSPNETLRDSESPKTTYLERAQTPCTVTEITHSPTLHFSRATWWDHLTNTYTLRPTNATSPSSISRHDVAQEISRDVCGFFKSSPVWLAFINVPLFFDMFHHTELRSAIQPSLVLSILAYSKLLQSERDTKRKDPEERERSWKQSVALRNLAQASFDASYNAGWVDLPLAQAAWILVLYEICSHPDCTLYRMQSAMSLLDNVIRVLGLTSLDATDPRVHMFAPNDVPALGRPPPNGVREQALKLGYSSPMGLLPAPPAGPSSNATLVRYQATSLSSPYNDWKSLMGQPSENGSSDIASCPCRALSLVNSPEALRCTPTWASLPRWVPNATYAEIRKEEGRRLVWGAVVMLGSEAAARQAGGILQLDLYVTKPENLALLLPGEDDYASLPDVDAKYSGKESQWALWSRTMLLWHACIQHASRGRPNTSLAGFSVSSSLSDDAIASRDDSDFAMRAWMETVAIEDALNSHSCITERTLVYQAREFLFIIRMQVSGGFRKFIPVAKTGINFEHDSAFKWLRQRHSIALSFEAVMHEDAESPGRKMLVNRPFIVYLFMASEWRALELWKLDPSLLFAVEVALTFQRLIDWYLQIWPCAEIQRWAANAASELRPICKHLGRDIDSLGGQHM